MKFTKRFFLLLSILLLISNSGLAFNIHFCDNKIAAISSVFNDIDEVCESENQSNEEDCCLKINKTHEECCSDKEIILKSKLEKAVVKNIFSDVDFVFSSNNFSSFSTDSNFNFQINNSTSISYDCYINSPPFFLLFCKNILYC